MRLLPVGGSIAGGKSSAFVEPTLLISYIRVISKLQWGKKKKLRQTDAIAIDTPVKKSNK